MNVLALFAGIGGIELGLEATGGFRTVCCVEKDRYAVEVLKTRMQEGTLADAPIWDDVTTFDGLPWRGLVDVVTGGFPCQDISAAGKGAGIAEGTRSGLWSEMFRIIREVRPRYVLIENVSMLLARGLGRVLSDLASCGYDADWNCIPARSVGAPHRRDRIFIVAHSLEPGLEGHAGDESGAGQEPARAGGSAGEAGLRSGMPDPRTWWLVDPADVDDAEGQLERPGLCEDEPRGERGRRPGDAGGAADEGRAIHDALRGRHGPQEERLRAGRDGTLNPDGGPTQPYVGRVAHGVPARVHRLRCLGNAVVPQVAYYVGLRILAHVKEAP